MEALHSAHLFIDNQMIVHSIYKQMCTVHYSLLAIVSASILHDLQDRYPLHPLLAHRPHILLPRHRLTLSLSLVSRINVVVCALALTLVPRIQ